MLFFTNVTLIIFFIIKISCSFLPKFLLCYNGILTIFSVTFLDFSTLNFSIFPNSVVKTIFLIEIFCSFETNSFKNFRSKYSIHNDV